METEKHMLRAHREGLEAFADMPHLTMQDVRDIANRTYLTSNERDAYVAGYNGALMRHNASRGITAI
jgi:hypothetical protein